MLHLDLFWNTLEILSVEEWSFAEFLYIVLGPVLLLLATTNQWARALIFYTVDFKVPPGDDAARLFMNVDIGFGQAEYGLLASIGFRTALGQIPEGVGMHEANRDLIARVGVQFVEIRDYRD